MKTILLIQAKYNRDGNQAVLSILNTLSNEEREKDRGSYYKSLSGLARHLVEGSLYIQSLAKTALSHNADILKALAPLEKISIPKGTLTEAQWKSAAAAFETVDNTTINLIASLTEADCKVPVQIPWYKGNPDAIPLYFLLENLMVHGSHHRGQISQILDELKIDNNYSGIKPEFLG